MALNQPILANQQQLMSKADELRKRRVQEFLPKTKAGKMDFAREHFDRQALNNVRAPLVQEVEDRFKAYRDNQTLENRAALMSAEKELAALDNMGTGGDAAKATKSGSGAAGKAAASKMAVDAITAGSDQADPAAGIASGAASGALTGASLGAGNPIAIGAGAVVGGTVGALQARAARKAQERALENKKLQQLSDIEGQRAQNINQAISNMASAIGNSLRIPVVRL